MCTYVTETFAAVGSGKGRDGWFPLRQASVYYDHPVHATPDHTLNIDFLNPDDGPAARVAVELTAPTARRLAQAILQTLDGAAAAGMTVPR